MRRWNGKKLFLAKKRSWTKKATRQQNPITSILMISADSHSDATEVARLNGKRMSDHPATIKMMPTTTFTVSFILIVVL